MDKKVKKIKFSLFVKYSILISLFLVITFIIIGLLLIHFQEEALIEEKQKSNAMLSNFVARMCTNPIKHLNYSLLETIAEELQNTENKSSEVLSVIISDPNGTKLNINGIERNNIDIPDRYWETRHRKIVISEDEPKYSLQLIFSLKSIYDKTKKVRNIFISTVVIATVFIVSVIILLFLFTITRPLKKLIKASNLISTGNFDINLDSRKNDEIGVLSDTFMMMSKELKLNFEKIKNYSEKLEDMVSQRTKELNEANVELQKKNKAMMRELQMAQRVQESIIPTEKDFPKRNELSFGSRYMSMESIGGDLYDIIRVGKHGYGFLMADVSGHGVPAALITTMAKVSFNTNSRWGVSPSEVCTAVNEDMCGLIGDLEHYLTAYYSIINLETGEFQYTNASHHPAILIRKRTRIYEKLDTDGFMIGVFDGAKYETKNIVLEEGDKILLFTDGIIEARNEDDDFYEYERLNDFIDKNLELSADQFVEKLIVEINEFCKTRTPDDDRAILCIEFVAKKSPDRSIEDSLKVETAKLSGDKLKMQIDDNFQNIDEILSKAGVYLKNKNYKEALNLLLKIRDYGVTTPRVLHSLGIVYYKLGELEKAQEILKQALEKDKNNTQLKNHLSIVNKKINS